MFSGLIQACSYVSDDANRKTLQEEMNEIFRDDIGKDIPVTYEFIANALQWAIDDLEKTMEYFRTGAYDYEMTRELSKELGMRSFRTWVREDSNFVTLQK